MLVLCDLRTFEDLQKIEKRYASARLAKIAGRSINKTDRMLGSLDVDFR